MSERSAETWLGALVLAAALGFFAFAFTQTQGAAAPARAAEYWGLFSQADGVAPGTEVRIAGVKVGVVRAVSLEPDTYNARVVLALDPNVRLLDSTAASIRSDGLLGGAYVSLEPAGLEPLPPGSEIYRTQGSQDLFTMIRSFADTMGGGGDGNASEEGASAP